jgi:hypothetical protein
MKKLTSLLLSFATAAALCYGDGYDTKGDAKAKPQPKASVEPKAAAAKTPPQSLANEWLRKQSPAFKDWDIGGQVRLRAENKENGGTTGDGVSDFRAIANTNDNDYFLSRIKLHVGYTQPWFSVYGEGRDSHSDGDYRPTEPESDSMDLHQGYVTFGNKKVFPLTAKLGRQELQYGDERLIGPLDWTNLGRVFDAAKLRYEVDDFWVDAWVSRPVLTDDSGFNVSNDYEYFSGIYASSKKWVSFQETQVYLLSRNASIDAATATTFPPFAGGASARDIYTIGGRVKSLPDKLNGWDYSAEIAGQFGRFKFTAAGNSLTHQAFASSFGLGYTWKDVWGTPRIGGEYNFATGDDNPGDSKHGTFDNLYPTNHKFYGFMDFASLQNIHNLRLSGSVKPHKTVTVMADLHSFFLDETADAFYQVNGVQRANGGLTAGSRGVAASATGYGANQTYDSYVGSEIDLTTVWAIRPWATLGIGYSHFFRGDYIKNTLNPAGGSADANWIYGQFTVNF